MAELSPSVSSNLSFFLACIAIVANSLTAGGVFMFPVFSPAFSSVLKFSQVQLTTISVAGLIGQYPLAPLVGKILDVYGPYACSLIAGLLFFFSFSGTSLELVFASSDLTQPNAFSFCRLIFFFLLAGLGTIFSYFSSVFAATRMLPHRPGLASGFSLAFFGLSPLFLSIFSKCFTDSSSASLLVVPFVTTLALLTLTTHLFAAVIYRAISSKNENSINSANEIVPVDENAPLLTPKLLDQVPSVYPSPVTDRYFWSLAFYCFIIIGTCEMIMSNLAAIIMSLPPKATPLQSLLSDSSRQVEILSISNTVSRLLIGPLADFLSPVSSCPIPAIAETNITRKCNISRVVFLTSSAILLVIAFIMMELRVRYQEELWILSVCTGISYGVVFTILPGVVSSLWGPNDLGRNFGIITYAPFLGTPFFSFLYAQTSVAHSEGANVCRGILCWQTTFLVTLVTSVIALCVSLILWKRWKGRV